MSNYPLPITLNFSDIHSFGELEAMKSTLKTGGVYIWGFVFEKDAKGLPFGEPLKYEVVKQFDATKHCFIPYYVGKSINNIHGRLTRHQIEASQKYLMFHPDYLLKFFNDPDFPSEGLTGPEDKQREWYLKKHPYFKNKILYYKCKPMLEDIYHISANGHDKLVKIGDGYTFNSLEQSLRLGANKAYNSVVARQAAYFNLNQFFTFASANCSFINYDWLEACTYYSLKGKTISKHEDFNYLRMENSQCQIDLVVKSNFQYVQDLFKDGISRVFPGYCK